MNMPSPFGIGTLHMGSLLDLEASKTIILEALDRGLSFFDTAPLYGNGKSEEILGDVLSGIKEKAFICTKAGLRIAQRQDKKFGVEVEPLNEQNLRFSVERSLKRLRRESIDLLMLHAFDPQTPIEETVDALNTLYKEGKIKSFGCSNYNPDQLQRLVKHTPPSLPFRAAQCHYNMIERRAGKTFIPFCEKNNVWVVVNRALARGALTGQYVPGQEFRPNSRAAKSPRIQKWLTPEKLHLLGALSSLAQNRGASLMNVALKWLLKNHSQMIILLGVRNKLQLEESLSAASGKIDEPLFLQIEQVLKKEKKDVYQFPPRYFEK